MHSEEIWKQARALVQDCGTRDTLQIARQMGLHVSELDTFENLLGLYTYRWHHGIILLNAKLDPVMRQMVCGHEIGHHVRHRKLVAGGQSFQEFTLFNIKDTTEYEANAFLAHLTLDTDQVWQLAKDGEDVVSMAQKMYTNVNVMLIKLQEMRTMGYDLHMPEPADARFFRKVKTEGAEKN